MRGDCLPSTVAKFGVFAGMLCSPILTWATVPFGAAWLS